MTRLIRDGPVTARLVKVVGANGTLMGLVPANLTLREVRVMFGNHTIRWNGHLACWESKETETTANAA